MFFFFKKKLINKAVTDDDADVGFYAQCTKMSEDQFQRKRVRKE